MPNLSGLRSAISTENAMATAFLEALFAPIKVSADQIVQLLVPFHQAPHIRRHAATVITSRVRLVAALFALAVPLWSVLDWLVLPAPEWALMAALRFLSALAFGALAWPWAMESTRFRADALLFALLSVPPAFSLASLGILENAPVTEGGRLVASLLWRDNDGDVRASTKMT